MASRFNKYARDPGTGQRYLVKRGTLQRGRRPPVRMRDVLARYGRLPSSGAGYLRTGGYYGRFNKEGGEMKFFDTNIAISNVTNAFVEGTNEIPCLNIIPQGDTQSSRDGRRIWIKSIHLHAFIDTGTEQTTFPAAMRIILYLDTQCNGASITGAQLLTTFSVNSFRNIENTQRIKVLMDKTFVINPTTVNTAATTVIPNRVRVKWNKKVNLPLDYDSTATTGVLTTVRGNNLGIMYIPATGADTLDVNGFVRVRFTETMR